MNRFQRRLHLLLWLVVLPVCAAILWFGINAESADESDFGTTPRSAVPE